MNRTTKKNQALAALLEASQALVTSLELSTVLQTIVETATHLLALDTGAIYLVEGDELFLGATTPPLPADLPDVFRRTPLDRHPHIQRSLRIRGPVVIPDTEAEDFSPEESQILETRDLRSLVYLPIFMDCRALGVLILGTEGRTRIYPKYEIDLYRTFSNQAAVVIENAHLYKNLRTHADRLERQIEERKHAEALQHTLQEQLLHSQKMESLGILASGIAHDFNNILSIIIGHAAELEKHHTDPARRVKNVESIMKAGNRGTSLVKQMLTFARKAETVIRSVSLNDVVLETAKMLRETFPRTVMIVTELAPELTAIEADATQVQQILLNLCVNSRDAMPDGGTITITTTRAPGTELKAQNPLASDVDYVVLRVSDTGIGMNAETRKHIFEPFFTTKDFGQGTGLGLSLVFGIMQTHKGFVTVESESGRGTTFQCCFPVPDSVPQYVESGEFLPLSARGGTETILVVEDEQELRSLYAVALERKGYTVLTAPNGEEGLRLFLEHRSQIRLVFSDVGLPKMSGDALFRRVASIDPSMPVILASGYVDLQVKARLLAEGVRDFIEKPYQPETVLQTIRQVLDKNGP